VSPVARARARRAGRSALEKKRGRYHHGDLRRALLDAALELLAREGASALTLREVARRAGVTHAAPYRHFTDKQALLAAVAEEGFTGRTRWGPWRPWGWRTSASPPASAPTSR